jgi:O-antigen/teichoic acid export membrane protein
MYKLLTRYRSSTLARNTVWMFLGQGLRLVIQAGYFILIARSLGAKQYGSFVAAAALVSILAPFVGLGSDKMIIKNVARKRSTLDECFANGLLMTVLTGAIALTLTLAACRLILPQSVAFVTILMVALSDLILFRIIDLVGSAFQSLEMLAWTAKVNVLVSAIRFAGIALLALFISHITASEWSIVYTLTTGIAVAASLVFVKRIIKTLPFSAERARGELLEGFYFSGGESAQSIYNDLDKSMLARLSTLDATGIYAAAYRLVDVAFVPVRSLVFAAYPGFFREAERKATGTYRYACKLLPKALLAGVFTSAAVMLGAPLVPKILGVEYAHTVEALRWLAVLPLLKTVHYFFADALTGAGYQGLRMFLQILVAVFNIGLNLWILPMYSWRGAVWSSLASDGLLALLVWFTLYAIRRSEDSDYRGTLPFLGDKQPVQGTSVTVGAVPVLLEPQRDSGPGSQLKF